MKFKELFFLLVLFVFAAGVATSSAETEPPKSRGEASNLSLDFKDVELSDLIRTVSEISGKNFLFDETVRGKVSIISPEAMSEEEVWQLFLTVLNVKGFAVVPSGKVNKIVPTRMAKEATLPTVTGGEMLSGEAFVTSLIRLKNCDASEIATTVLAPLIPKTSHIVAYPPTNTLIVTDTASNIERLQQIVHELDAPSSLDTIEVLSLKYAAADEVAKIGNQIINETGATPGRRARAVNVKVTGEKDATKIIPYSRSNSLIIMATSEDMDALKALIAELDKKPSQDRSHINVYYLENADAETLAKTLNEIVTGIKTNAKTNPPIQGAVAPLRSDAVSITADKPTNALIVNASPEDYETIRAIVRQLDIKRKQVFVEALIMDISMDATRRLGASLQGVVEVGSENAVFGSSNLNGAVPGGGAGLTDFVADSATGLPSLLGKTIQGILLGGLFNPVQVEGPNGDLVTVPAMSALIDLSKTDSDINILSAPRLLTSDNEEAEIVVGSNVPIITSRLTDTGGGAGLAQSVAVERKDVALTLRFTPQVTEGDLVRLNVFQEITNIASSSVGDVNEVGPTLTKRLLRNTVQVEDGRTVVLGGLIGTNTQTVVTKVPFLGDIPLLGWLFKRKGTQEVKTNLIVFMTPHIIRSVEDMARITGKSREMMNRVVRGEPIEVDIEESSEISLNGEISPKEGVQDSE